MQQLSSYRNYAIYQDQGQFIAEPASSDGSLFRLTSSKLQQLHSAVDELWDALNASTTLGSAPALPPWYQAWLDKGGTGQIDLTDTVEKRSRLPGAWYTKPSFIFAMAACMVAAVLSPELDFNKDGSIDMEDYASLVEKAYLANPPKFSHRRVRSGDRVYEISMMPAPESTIDFDIVESTWGRGSTASVE